MSLQPGHFSHLLDSKLYSRLVEGKRWRGCVHLRDRLLWALAAVLDSPLLLLLLLWWLLLLLLLLHVVRVVVGGRCLLSTTTAAWILQVVLPLFSVPLVLLLLVTLLVRVCHVVILLLHFL